jgi:hypothetical protein
MRAHREDEPITILISELARETTALVSQEMALARVEIGEKVDRATSGVTSLAVGGAVTYAGLLVLLAAAVAGLDGLLQNLPLSALIVGAVVVLVGAALLFRGRRNLSAERLAPRRTVESLRRDTDLAREQMRRSA